MMPDEDDDLDLLKSYRSASHGMPDVVLDRRILAAASGSRARQRLLPLMLAMTVAILIALYAAWSRSGPVPAAAPRSSELTQAGLNDGRIAQFLSDPQAMQQSALRQLGGGSD